MKPEKQSVDTDDAPENEQVKVDEIPVSDQTTAKESPEDISMESNMKEKADKKRVRQNRF